ncbi:MAG: hypothetical protein HN742_05050 [Lentisphaerae bacterium]|nr:hypothetical protein [Lentisphaerota bacterium]MBT4817065.1 hypothetical protein [Lentisphaerota bacterium]MBT5610815.1 hypothetical protein [Lentisphaerota bacterium]MBT7053753.1 hypothetical protein [Lentisphaerota bacterium]MBT7841214.1 hypothetical protein [Lentisphaerota bacterium]
MNPVSARLARALDGIAYCLLATTLIVFLPYVGRTPLGELGHLHILPVLGLCAATLRLPSPSSSEEATTHLLWRLKASAVTVLGLTPFVSWWLRTLDSPYFLVAGTAGLFAANWYLFELASFIRAVLHKCGNERILFEAKLARVLTFYCVFIPTLGVNLTFVGALILVRGTVLSDLERTWEYLPYPVRFLMLLAVLNLLFLVWRVHSVVLNHVVNNPTDQGASQRDSEPRPQHEVDRPA